MPQEVSTCKYLFRVGVSSLCRHPDLAPKPVPTRGVVCRPLFSSEYDDIPFLTEFGDEEAFVDPQALLVKAVLELEEEKEFQRAIAAMGHDRWDELLAEAERTGGRVEIERIEDGLVRFVLVEKEKRKMKTEAAAGNKDDPNDSGDGAEIPPGGEEERDAEISKQ